MTQKDITFQVLDWSFCDKEADDGDKKYIVRLFGMTIDMKTIYVEVTKFTPYFYVEVPDKWTKLQADELINAIKCRIPREFKNIDVKCTIMRKHKFWGFTASKLFTFVRLSFDSYEQFSKYRYAFDRPISIPSLHINQMKFGVYETNIEPMLRCMHSRDLMACGWITIHESDYTNIQKSDVNTTCDINISVPFSELNAHSGKESDIQPFKIAAVDIECVSEDGSFPQPTRVGDKIIMIATTFSKYGESDCYYRNVIVLGTCNKIEGADVIECETEKDVICEWSKMIQRTDPDFVTGWNIFGFDEVYIYERCKLLGISETTPHLSRFKFDKPAFTTKELASSALGDNILKYFEMTGRVHFDLMKVVQKDYKLDSYKLDSVSSTFFREIITKFETHGNDTLITTKGTFGIKEGQYTTIVHNDGVTDYEHMNKRKFRILKIEKNTLLLEGKIEFASLEPYLADPKHKIYWCQVKDDVKPKEIFSKFNGSIGDRTELAQYNIQDCELCNKLVAKLQVIVDNICMANVCNVPLYYLFVRGQGVKIFSLVSKKCRQKHYLIPVIRKKKVTKDEEQDEEEGYEGAIVFDAKPGLYLSPVFVLDYASLYPNSMRFRNLSHECIVLDEKYNNLPGYEYCDISYNQFAKVSAKKTETSTRTEPKENVSGQQQSEITCRFAKNKDGTMGILPEILTDLLNARSRTRKMIETEPDTFKKKVLDRMQLAYKVTANSLYGQTGATTSPLLMKDIAACTTATGREMLKFSRSFVEKIFNKVINYAIDDNAEKYMKYMKKKFGYVKKFNYIPNDTKFTCVMDDCADMNNHTPKHGIRTLCKCDVEHNDDVRCAFFEALQKKIRRFMSGYHIRANVIYGDTDSVFVDPHITSIKDGSLQTNKDALEKAIQLGILASMLICILLPEPMKQEYEKTLWPFAQISKKRYVGNLYETDPNKFYQKSMGIVLKRRDNAQIVKIMCGGIVDQLLNKRDPNGAIKFTQTILRKILSEEYPMDKFVITKTLRESYANRNSIAHAVLADRMTKRDPGNKPSSNDRIPYVFILTDKKTKLQGDHIETPEYVVQNKLKLDYVYYITNQIMKPSIQFLKLVADHPESIFERVITIERNRNKGILPVTSYYQ